jgi:multiple sugar transport system substrate-binding protein
MKFLVAAMLLFLAGCSAKADDREVVRFWGMGREGEVVAELIPEFEKQNPGIRIDLQQIPWSAAHEKLLTAFAGRVTPDIAQLGSSWVAELVALKALEPIDGWLAQSQSVNAEDFFPGTWKGNVIGGRTWGVPWYADTRLLFYRKDLLQRAGFSQVPQDWSGWTAAMQAIKKRAPKDSYAIFLPTNEYDPLIALALQQPEPLLRNGGRYGNFRSDSFKKVTDFYLGLYQQGLAPRASNTEISNVYDEFARGRFAFYITGPWNIGEFKSRLPADLQDDWMTAPLPGPTGPGASTAGGSSLAMFRRSEHKGAAWKFIEYLSRPDVQLRFFELTGDLPPRRSVWDQPLLANDPYATAFRQQLERTVAAPAVPEWERIATQMQLGTERAVAGQISGEQLRAQLDARADSILEKRRWKLAREARQ